MNDLRRGKTLVIDDENYMRQVMSLLLTEFGIKDISLAKDGKEALSLIDECETSYDLLLCDLNMPNIDGIELLRLFSERNFQGDIIIVSGSNKKTLQAAEKLAASYQLNILGYIEKPIKYSNLKQLLNQTRKTVPFKEKYQITSDQITRCIENKNLTLFYQPQISLDTGYVDSFETLIRWKTPNGNIIGPNHFIPLAEKTNQIGKISTYVLKRGVNQLANWHQQGLELSLSLNLSTFDLKNTNFPSELLALVNKVNLSPDKLTLEVTESRIAEDEKIVIEVLSRLHMHGFKLAIDDFGTGYSSLDQLTKIPFSELKLDYSFVHNMLSDKTSEAIVDSSIGLAKRLDLTIVAEGVEDENSYQSIINKGCDKVQGYYVAKAMSGVEVLSWVKDFNAKRQRSIL